MDNFSPQYLTSVAVRRVLTWEMCIDAVEAALKAVVKPTTHGNSNTNSNVKCDQPPRSITKASSNKLLLTMPTYVSGYRLKDQNQDGTGNGKEKETLVCKVVTSFEGNSDQVPPLPNIMAQILMFNTSNGRVETIMDGTDITIWRTVAASIVATKHLYFRRFGPNAENERSITLAIIGCGAQGSMHAIAMSKVFKVHQIYLYNRTMHKAMEVMNRLKTELDGKGNGNGQCPEVVVTENVKAACETADVICIATYSSVALINATDIHPKRDRHINAVGAGRVHFGELSNEVYKESQVYVDCYANAKAELGGFPVPIAGEVGQVILNGPNENILKPKSLTIFQSMGMGAEDACVAQAVYDAIKYSESQ